MLMLNTGEKHPYTNSHVLVVNGATREGGNTDTVVSLFAEGTQTAGLYADRIRLRDLNIADCVGCCTCLRESRCHFEDDMTALRKEIIDSSILVLASPLYFCEVTGLMKTFIDRLYFFYHDVNKKLVAGKKVTIIVTLGEKETGFETEIVEESYRRLLAALDMMLVDMHFFPGLMEKEAVHQKPAYLEQAYNIGNGTAAVLIEQ